MLFIPRKQVNFMAKASKSQKTARRNLFLYKAALVIFSTLIIVWLMPRDATPSYTYEVGKPWRYGLLIADFRFPIYKSDAEMKREQDSVLREFKPYYNLDNTVANKMKNRLATLNRQESVKGASSYVEHICALLDSVYNRGVLTVEEYNNLKEHKYSDIRIVHHNSAVSHPVASIFSTKSAYEYIMSTDSARYSRIIMQNYNINDLLVPNIFLDTKKTEAAKTEVLINASTGGIGFVQKGQQIIDRGELVTNEQYNILQSLERELAKDKSDDQFMTYSLIGQIVFVLSIMLVLVSYLTLFRDDYFDKYQSGILLFGLTAGFCVVAFLMVRHQFLNVFILPCCMVPIVIRVFMDSRTAFMFHTAMVLIISTTLRSPYEFVMLQLLTGMIAIQTLRELSQRSQIIHTAALITLFYVIFYSSYELIVENTYAKADRSMYIYFIINGVLLVFTYPLLWLFEKGFGFVSDVTLVELSNISHPLLQRMSEIAPGTFQHSLQVSNLSAEVAKKIGARSQLVRTAALYHDIGKLERPVFFTENQKGMSPHKHLTPQKSAEVIINHITHGLSLADHHNLPELIKGFIRSHHGNGMTKYFYITYKNEHPDEEVDKSMFSYPGPNPSTKEEAILMMADAVEAASRSLTDYTEETISQLVDKIVDSQVSEGFFAECDITFRDIAIAKEVFKEKLKIVYHTRISYPELNKENEK